MEKSTIYRAKLLTANQFIPRKEVSINHKIKFKVTEELLVEYSAYKTCKELLTGIKIPMLSLHCLNQTDFAKIYRSLTFSKFFFPPNIKTVILEDSSSVNLFCEFYNSQAELIPYTPIIKISDLAEINPYLVNNQKQLREFKRYLKNLLALNNQNPFVKYPQIPKAVPIQKLNIRKTQN